MYHSQELFFIELYSDLEYLNDWNVSNCYVSFMKRLLKEQEETPGKSSNVARTGFFGRLTGLDIEAELQRHALLLKGRTLQFGCDRRPMSREWVFPKGVEKVEAIFFGWNLM